MLAALSRETGTIEHKICISPSYQYLYFHQFCITVRTGSRDYGGWEGSYLLFISRKASDGIQFKSKSLRNRRADVRGQEKTSVQLKQREKIHPTSVYLFYSSSQWIEWCLPTLMKAPFLLYGSSTNVFWKYSHRPATWALRSPVRWTYGNSHTISPIFYQLFIMRPQKN
jgi:hypothetical protein